MVVYLIVLRFLEYFNNVNIPFVGGFFRLFFEVWHRRQCGKYGVHIGKNVCGYGLRIIHIGGIHINANRVGNYCSITSGVICGKVHSNEERPYIGDHVGLTVGCKIIGKVNIGDNTTICPNTVVITDIPANSIASGVPVSIIKDKRK